MTSKSKIIEYLQEHGQIDNFYCIDSRLTTRLSDYIFRLKKSGWDFRTEMKEKNCFYFVIKKPESKETPELLNKPKEDVKVGLFPSYPKVNESTKRWRY